MFGFSQRIGIDEIALDRSVGSTVDGVFGVQSFFDHGRALAALPRAAVNIPRESGAFLDAATEAAKQIAEADTVAEWQTECDKVAESRNQILDEGLTATQRKQCDQIMEQMEIGKLSVEMKKVDAKVGKKQCSLVAADILRNVKALKNADSKGKA